MLCFLKSTGGYALRAQAWYEEVAAHYQQGKSIAAIAREL